MLERKTRQLPRGKLITWDGTVESYHDFKMQMNSFLVYDCEYLNLSTLKGQIQGKDKNHILTLLHNVEDKNECFQVLDMHFGNIRTTLPRLREKLNKLRDHPESKSEQVDNVQCLLNYYKTAKQHNLHESEINFSFIQDYSSKLSEVQKLELIALDIDTCGPFIAKIKEYQRINLQFIHTTKTQNVKSFQNVSRTGENNYGQDQAVGRQQNNDPANQPSSRFNQPGGWANGPGNQPGSRFSQPGGWANGPGNQPGPRSHQLGARGNGTYNNKYNVKCLNCDGPHITTRCPHLTKENDAAKVKLLIQEKVCLLCIRRKHDGLCNDRSTPYICPKHKQNQLICKCSESNWRKPRIQNNATNVVNGSALGVVGFESEMVVIKNGNKQKRVMLTYDSFASHTTMNESLQQDLGLTANPLGNVEIQTYAGSVQEQSFMVSAQIEGVHSRKIDFLLSSNAQKMPLCQYKIPNFWIQKYKLPIDPKSASGLNMITIGKDQCSLFPVLIATCDGVAVSRSNVTGQYLLSGRAQKSSESGLMDNRTVISEDDPLQQNMKFKTPNISSARNKEKIKVKNNSDSSSLTRSETAKSSAPLFGSENCTINLPQDFSTPQNPLEDTSKPQPTEAQENVQKQIQIASIWPESKDVLLRELTTDSINVHPIKRCSKCSNCKDCKKSHLPDPTRQLEQAKIVKESLTFKDNTYTAEYPYNELLSQLPTNELACMRMMKNLEAKLRKEGLVEAFNENVADFMRRGVIRWVEDVPGIKNLQKSYIPLTYALREGTGVTTKLRICGNSSFRSGPNISLNSCMIPGPKYLNNMEGILLRFRVANQIALGDIKNCYHKILSGPKDASLRRIFIKPDGMGSDNEWKEACFNTVSFGDVLGGATAQAAISDCSEKFISAPTRNIVQNSIYMDDLLIGADEDIEQKIKEVDSGLKQGNFIVKQWTKTGDPVDTKCLSYTYHAKTDKFSVRPKINWSPKKRGVRKSVDCKTYQEIMDHVNIYGLTKRTVASILMGTIHDPLGVCLPYVNNLKFVYRDICRENTEWDKEISEQMKSKVIAALNHFIEIEKIEFERKAIFTEARKLTFKFYFDGSLQGIGVSVVCLSELPNGEKVYRLLCNKAKILGNDVTTAPRSELCACLISTRLYILVTEQLRDFLNVFKGEVKFQILGDSLVVLNQIKQNSYNFATFAASRIQEIRENTKDFDISWHHVSSQNNVSDILTRPHDFSPQELPWAKYTMDINEENLQTSDIPVPNLPDSDKRNILALAQVTKPLEVPDLPTIMLYAELRKRTCAEKKEHSPNVQIQGVLKRKSSYFKCRNVISKILQWHPAHKGRNLNELQELSENKIFEEFQSEAETYVKNFRGSMFYTFRRNNILMLRGRDTIYGTTEYKLVPTKTLLYHRMTETYHSKFHKMAASPVYIRAQMLADGFYVPQAVQRLKALQDKCPHCRKRLKQSLHTVMGQIGEKRLTHNAPFVHSQADLIGPYYVKEFYNSRGTRKMWILVSICSFSRFISLTPVEDLSKTSILNAFENHFHRFGRSLSIETDLGSNFTAAKNDLEGADSLNETDITDIYQNLKSSGVSLIQRVARSPFMQGGVERANQIVKRIFPEKRMTVFQTLNIIEYIQHVVNQRPIGLSSTSENIKPADVVPIWSKIQPGECFMKNCSKILNDAIQDFRRKWDCLYKSSVLQQKKWMASNHELKEEDLVLILDLKNHLNYPRIGRISKMDTDSAGVERYFHVTYKDGNKKRDKSVKRSAQSLVLLLKKTEDDQAKISDSLFWCPDTVNISGEKKRVMVKADNSNAETIQDL